MTEPVWSVTGHRPGCDGAAGRGECECFDDLDPDDDDGSDYYVDGDTGW